MNDPELKKIAELLEELKEIPIRLDIDGLFAFQIITQIQLALRHPQNRGETSDRTRKFAIDLQNGIVDRVPEIKSILDKGWHPEWDVDLKNDE